MPKLVLLGWNLLNFGESKWKVSRGRNERLNLIAKVVKENDVDVVGFTEIRSKKGKPIGDALVKLLNHLTPMKVWKSQPSDVFTTGSSPKHQWHEQYLYLWNTKKVDVYMSPSGKFQYRFDNPPGTKLKFPGVPPNKGRPPWLGFFQVTDGTPHNPKIVVAIMHSPGPGSKNPGTKKLLAEAAAQEMAKILPLTTEGDFTVIMGDFNIKANQTGNVDMNDTASNGYAAFHALSPNFDQYLQVRQSSTASKWKPNMTIGDCYSNPYDQVFVRHPAPPASGNGDMDELIEDCVTPPIVSEPSIKKSGYLGPLLAALEAKVNGTAAPTHYSTIEEPFVQFRDKVSDHAPVLADITYT